MFNEVKIAQEELKIADEGARIEAVLAASTTPVADSFLFYEVSETEAMLQGIVENLLSDDLPEKIKYHDFIRLVNRIIRHDAAFSTKSQAYQEIYQAIVKKHCGESIAFIQEALSLEALSQNPDFTDAQYAEQYANIYREFISTENSIYINISDRATKNCRPDGKSRSELVQALTAAFKEVIGMLSQDILMALHKDKHAYEKIIKGFQRDLKAAETDTHKILKKTSKKILKYEDRNEDIAKLLAKIPANYEKAKRKNDSLGMKLKKHEKILADIEFPSTLFAPVIECKQKIASLIDYNNQMRGYIDERMSFDQINTTERRRNSSYSGTQSGYNSTAEQDSSTNDELSLNRSQSIEVRSLMAIEASEQPSTGPMEAKKKKAFVKGNKDRNKKSLLKSKPTSEEDSISARSSGRFSALRHANSLPSDADERPTFGSGSFGKQIMHGFRSGSGSGKKFEFNFEDLLAQSRSPVNHSDGHLHEATSGDYTTDGFSSGDSEKFNPTQMFTSRRKKPNFIDHDQAPVIHDDDDDNEKDTKMALKKMFDD